MNTNARDMYISVLEKRAAEAVAPDYSVDNQAVANSEVASNNGDQRAQIGGLLSAAKATEKATTKQVGQLLPIAKKTTGTTASNPLLKVAMHEAFFSGVRQTDILKTAELEYLRTAYQGFEDEMGKLAGLVGTALKAGKKPLASGSVVKKMPSRGGLTRHGTPAPKKAPLTLAEEARFGKAPQQVGSGVWKLAHFAHPRFQDAVEKFAASFTSEQAIRAQQEQESLPENSDPSQTAFRSTAR